MTDCVYFSARPQRVSLSEQINQIVARIKAMPPGSKRALVEAELSNIAGVIRVLGDRLNDTVGRMSPLRQPGKAYRE
jgi:hypothetical protein